MLTLTVLGCDGSYAGPGGSASGYLLRSWTSGTSIWIDAGPGTFSNLQKFTDPTRLSAIVLTHRHTDHCSDVVGFETAARWVWGWKLPPIPVFAPAGVRERLGLDRPDRGDPVLLWHEVGDGALVEEGGIRLSFSRTDHGPETLAVRADGDGGSLGYSADSGPGWAIRSLGSGLDLALCEATFTSEHEGIPGHMSARQAGRNARDAGAKRLVVTHRWATMDAGQVLAEATAAFGATVHQAVAGAGYSL
jgi:ribonuclease BN (tRNA processing enzyme)